MFICKLNYERRFQVDNVPKKLQNQIVAQKLSGRFTEAQIDIMCSDKKRTRSNKYSREDYLFALKVKQLSPRAVKAIKKILPMPDNKTTSTKFSWIHSIPGYLQPVIKLFKLLDGKLEENENLCMINFDEMYEKNKCGLDTKLKMLIGPAKSVQVLQVRSLVGHLKYPVLFRNNYPMSKKCINETIHTLESVNLKILFSCCDQGGSNEGLQKSLKTTLLKIHLIQVEESSLDTTIGMH